MAGTDKSSLVFLVVHEAPQVRADPRKSNVSFVRPVDDDARRIVQYDVLRLADREFFFAENKFFCPGLTCRGYRKETRVVRPRKANILFKNSRRLVMAVV